MTDVTRTPRRKRTTNTVTSNAASESPSVTTDTTEALETRSMSVVFRGIVRAQTRALVFERLAVVAGDLFRGNECRPPALLMKLPGGGAFPAELEDIIEIESELARMASSERIKIARLMASAVLAKADDVDPHEVSGEPYVPYVPAPDGELLVENPTAKLRIGRVP